MAKTKREPQITVATVLSDALRVPCAVQFVDTCDIVFLVREGLVGFGVAELRAAIAASDGIPPPVWKNGKPCGPGATFALEAVPDAPFYVLAIGKGKEDAAQE